MNITSMSQARAVTAYEAPYADPITVQAGDQVSIDSTRKTNCVGWVWCTNRAGKSGWVPETYLEQHGNIGHMRCDYDAIELTIQVGDILTVHKAESGFFWVTDPSGRTGWVPSTHVELSTDDCE